MTHLGSPYQGAFFVCGWYGIDGPGLAATACDRRDKMAQNKMAQKW